MPKRLTYNEVKAYIEEDSGGDCILLSTEYVNDTTPLLLQCKCGNTFTRPLRKLKARHSYICKKCSKKKAHDRYALSYEEVKNKVSQKGCTLISENYYNNSQKLLIRCKCGNIFERSFAKFNSGQVNCKKCSRIKTAKAKIKYTQDIVIQELSKRGYTLIGDYVDWKHDITCKCSRNHIFKINFLKFIHNQAGCKKCANENLRGFNHYNYKGGESEIIDFLRKNIKQWKKDVLKKYNYRCYITGNKSNIVIHHLKSFNTIVKEVFKELNLDVKRKLKDYTQEEVEIIRKLINEKHDANNGVVVYRPIHNNFHEIYGKGNNTLEQFNQFISSYYPNVKLL